MSLRDISSQLHDLAQRPEVYVYLRTQDTAQVDGERAGRPWFTLLVERKYAGAWSQLRTAGDDLEAVVAEMAAKVGRPPAKQVRRRVVRRR